MATKKIWISRDSDCDDIYFWKTKPIRTSEEDGYTCACKNPCICEISCLDSAGCSDLEEILEAIGAMVKEREVAEITCSVALTQHKTLGDEAQKLVKQMKSRGKQPTKQQIMALLSKVVDADDDE